MAEFIPVSLITNNLTECPICTEQFEDEVRIPRRMPCCVQSICQPCLETYSQGQKKVPCPMCRCEHLLPGGVTSLAKEPLILRILEQLKIQKGVKIPCTECPDKNNAVARCEDCCISLCEDCLRAHRRVPTLKNHSVKTFEELKDLPIESVKRVHQCEEHRHPLEFYCTTCDKVICVSCTVLEHEKGDNHSVISISRAHKERSEAMNAFMTQLDKKEGDLTEAIKKLEVQRDMFTASSDKTKENVSSTFDSLIEVLQLKKATLLSLLDYKAESYLKQLQSTTEETKALLTQVRSSTEYTRNMRRKADQIEDIQLISSAMPTLQSVQGRKVQVLTSFDIINEIDAFTELKDLVNTYLQDVSHPETTPLFHQQANKTTRDSVDQFLSALPIMSDHDVIAQQRDEIQRLMETSLEPGDDWYLVDINWSQDLRSYLGLETGRHGLSRKSPGPIDNKPLLKENGQLKPHLVDGVDFHVYQEEAWKKLVSWFGVVDNQMPIQREVIMAANSPTHCQIEVYRYALKLRHSALDDDIRIQSFSRADTIDHLETTMRRTFGILEDKHVRIWRQYTNTWYDRLDNSLMTLEECGIHNGVTIIIDEMNEDRSWLINPVTENRRRSKTSKAWKE